MLEVLVSVLHGGHSRDREKVQESIRKSNWCDLSNGVALQNETERSCLGEEVVKKRDVSGL